VAANKENAWYSNLFLALARLGNVVRRLHTHQRIHLYSKGFFDTERMSPDRSALPLSKLDNVGRETRNAIAAAVTVKSAASIISVRMKSPGWGGFFMGMVSSPLA
jgi:hypothetical protein